MIGYPSRLDPLLRLPEQLVVLVHISTHPGIDSIILQLLGNFGYVGGHTKDLFVG
jgi:hypothetical protein